MLKFRSAMFFGESVKKEHRKLLRRLDRGKSVSKEITLITYAVNGRDLFDLIQAWELRLPFRKQQDLYVLGMAGSKEEAIDLAVEMVMEVYGKTGGFDVRSHFG